MRHFALPLIALALSACAAAWRPTTTYEPTAADLAAARAAIQPRFAEMMRAANAHDADAHLAAYAHVPTLSFVINDEVIRGWETLRQRQHEWWQDGKSDVVYALVDSALYSMPAPNVVVQTYILSSRRTAPDGSVREGRLAVTDVWQRRAEGWRIVYAHEAVVPRPSGR